MKQILFLLAAVLLLGGCAEEKKTDVRWATFNIRYDNPQDSLNNWQYRKDRVCQFIKDHELDIVGMQEVLHNQFQDLRAGLPEYDGIGVGRDDGKTAGEYAPLFYRKDKYEVLDSNTFWLAENPDSVGMMGWDAVCVRIAPLGQNLRTRLPERYSWLSILILTMWVKRPAVKAHCSLSVR